MNELKFSILMPVYNGSEYVEEAINSILRQRYKNFEIIICDDCSTDDTINTIKTIKDNRIKVFSNDVNLGYPKNLEKCRQMMSEDTTIIYLMGQDDVLAIDALLKTYNVFKTNPEVGVISRAYYQFDTKNFKYITRLGSPAISSSSFDIISYSSKDDVINTLVDSLGQLSGLAYIKKYFDIPFHEDIFVSHVYPFLSILKRYKAAYLNDFIVAVRTESSQCIHVSSIYDRSPLNSWVEMFNMIFNDRKYNNIKLCGIKRKSNDIIGLVQIKNYGRKYSYYREIFYHMKYNHGNLFRIKFWIITIGTLIIPRKVLIRMVRLYKNYILHNKLDNDNIYIEY